MLAGSDVWYEPQGEPEEDGEVDISLYSLSTGGKQPREPLESEVMWLPHFDWQSCEAKTVADKKRLQKQFLSDAWHYLEAKDPNRVKYLEKKFDDPNTPRWRSWFVRAKKYKAAKMRKKVS